MRGLFDKDNGKQNRTKDRDDDQGKSDGYVSKQSFWASKREKESDFGNKFDDIGDPRQIQAESLIISVSGVIEAGEVVQDLLIFLLQIQCQDEESLRIEYSIQSKDGWEYISKSNNDSGPSGISQLSTSHNLNSQNIVWNFPFECTYKTQNLFGWPQLIVRLSGPDFIGRSVVKGYGSTHLPTTPGYHERIIRIFKPLPTSWFTGLLGYLLGNMAELKNFDKVISSGEGREVTRVCSQGYVKVKFNITLVNFEKFGYI